MAKFNRLGEEVSEIMLDTNIISNLMRLKNETTKKIFEKVAMENSKVSERTICQAEVP